MSINEAATMSATLRVSYPSCRFARSAVLPVKGAGKCGKVQESEGVQANANPAMRPTREDMPVKMAPICCLFVCVFLFLLYLGQRCLFEWTTGCSASSAGCLGLRNDATGSRNPQDPGTHRRCRRRKAWITSGVQRSARTSQTGRPVEREPRDTVDRRAL